ncbi:DinB family protein [Klugiella xanthotipulae]|uniref:DinB-like domain-containing protein n=1 Tax=Klugiella xanthotipulae TaxID=244735 RepID=A0A543HY69_9MICO|nr:DinB family protein [Klugiella xanthotipulae]TQM63296.1 hypothetical protein FB466_1554 [Klugiella xanthotipulae]
MTMTPETKDWTWVLTERCAECGLAVADLDYDDIPALVRATIVPWQAGLATPNVRVRPAVETWSILEYACHVRDAHRIFGERVGLMLTHDNPTYPNWSPDAAAAEARYNEQDPATVWRELAAAGEVTVGVFAAVPRDQRDRPGLRSNGSAFTIDSLLRYYLHDVFHHVGDLDRQNPLLEGADA